MTKTHRRLYIILGALAALALAWTLLFVAFGSGSGHRYPHGNGLTSR